MIKIIPYKKEHVELMDLRSHEKELLQDNAMYEFLEGGIASTAIVNGVVVCSYGIIPQIKGVATIWLLPTIYVENKESLRVARGAKAWVEQMQQDLSLHRMETACVADALHDRWMTFLDFECEGVKRKYCNGLDYKQWGRIWG